MPKIIYLGLTTVLLATLAGCQTQSQSTTSESAVASSTAKQPTALASIKVPVDEALTIFEKQYPQIKVTHLELETTLGQYFYEIEGLTSTDEVSLRINAKTKAVSDQQSEKLDADDQDTDDSLDLKSLLSLKKVTAIAQKAVGSGQAISWELEKEVGITHWTVAVKHGRQTTDVQINAQTGEVLTKEVDD